MRTGDMRCNMRCYRRPGWSADKRKWIVDLVDLCLRSSVCKFKENWYIQKNGVPNGGFLCVQLANIAVLYVMNKAIYSKPQLKQSVKEALRYKKDGAVFFMGSERSFNTWMNAVNTTLQPYDLFIDDIDQRHWWIWAAPRYFFASTKMENYRQIC